MMDSCKNCKYSDRPSFCDAAYCDGKSHFTPVSNDQRIKSDAGKYQLSLVPTQGIKDVAEVRAYGVAKYGSSDNWKQVEPKRYIDALYRHLLAVVDDPQSVDPESNIKHYKHIACNAMFLCEVLRNGAADCIKNNAAIEQLRDLINDRKSFLTGEDDEIYFDDINALEIAITALGGVDAE